jgi:hypothetical protein
MVEVDYTVPLCRNANASFLKLIRCTIRLDMSCAKGKLFSSFCLWTQQPAPYPTGSLQGGTV